jgi:hypothetical protein
MDDSVKWCIIRTEDGMALGSYGSKPKALAAALRLSQDGRRYDVVKEFAERASSSRSFGVLLPLRGH